MKTKLSLLGLTFICSLTFFLISAFAQESDPASSAEGTYHDRLLRDAGSSSMRASSSRPPFPFRNNQQSNVTPYITRNGPAWRYFDPAAAKEIVESNAAVDKLIETLKSAESEEDKLTAKKQIQDELEKQYDFYLEQHEVPLQELEAKLEKLRKEFEWRKNARDDLVRLRLDTIWYNAQGLGWPGGQSTPSLLNRSFGIQGQNLFTPRAPALPKVPAAVRGSSR
jgi:hypothetical protein